jgi:hypothetical protein
MRIQQLTLLITLLAGIPCLAQDQPPATEVTDVVKLTLLTPGIGYEKRMTAQQSLYVQGYLSLSGGVGYSSSLGWLSELYIDPSLSAEYRFYFNFLSRQERGRRTAMNSANYVAPFFNVDFPKRNKLTSSGSVVKKRRGVYTIGGTVGMQRNYKSRLSLDLNIGFGYIFREPPIPDDAGQQMGTRSGQLTIPGRLSLGIWLNKKR